MAKYSNASDRISYLLGWGPYRGTPKTLTAQRNGINPDTQQPSVDIFSYGLMIVTERREDTNGLMTYLVHPRNNSLTTNRHIDAANMLFGQNGWTKDGLTANGWTVWTWRGTPIDMS